MAKKNEREIPYRVYKKLFADCPSRDYRGGKITVAFPEDYLKSKMYVPEGWYRGNNYICKNFGRASGGLSIGANVAWYSDGGCQYYDVTITVGNVFCGGTQKTKQYIRSFDAAVRCAKEFAEEFAK